MTPQQQASLNFVEQTPTPGAAAASAPSGNPSFWESALPTVGAIGGGVLGTIFGGPLGGIAGAGLGSSLGQEGENLAAGTHGSTLGAAASGAIGQGIGMGLGGLAGSVLGKIGSAATDAATQSALQRGFGNLSTNVLDKFNFPEAANAAQAMGLGADPQAWADAAQAANGPEGLYNNAVDRAITQAGMKLNLNDVQQAANDAIGNNRVLGDIGATTTKGARVIPQVNDANQVRAEVTDLLSPLENGIRTGNISATDARDVLQNIGRRYGDYNTIATNARTAGVDNTIARAKANVLGSVYNNLKKQIFTPEANGQIAAMNPFDAANYPSEAADLQRVSLLYGPDVANTLGQKLANAQDAQTLLDEMHQMGNIGELGTRAASRSNINDIFGKTAAGGGTSVPGHTALGLFAHLHPVLGAGAALAGAASKLPPETVQGLTGALARIATPGVGGALGSAVATAGGAGNNSNQGQGAATVNNQAQQAAGAGAGGFNPNEEAQYLMQAMQVNPYAASSLAPVLAQLLPQLQKAGAGQAELANLSGLYNQATGGPGILNQLASYIPGTAAHQYAAMAPGVQQQLAGAGVPFAAPSLMAGPGVAAQAFGMPSTALQSIAQPQNFQGTPGIPASSLLATLPLGY